MFGWSGTRRIIYFLLLVVVIGGIAGALYVFYKPEPTCTDGRKNGDELGVDCGGSCAKVCPLEIQDLKVLWSRIFEVSPGRYDVATMIENPNPRHGVKLLRYKIDILDANNLLINIINGETFINPREPFVIFNGRVEVGTRKPVRAVFDFTEPPIWQKVEVAIPKLRLDSQLFVNTPTPRLSALISNDSLSNLQNITVVALLSDADGNSIAASSTFIEYLDAGSSREIVFTWPASFPAEPAFIDLFPHFDVAQLAAHD